MIFSEIDNDYLLTNANLLQVDAIVDLVNHAYNECFGSYLKDISKNVKTNKSEIELIIDLKIITNNYSFLSTSKQIL